MSPQERITRLRQTVFYFTAAYGILFWHTSGDSFCFRSGDRPHWLVTARLAFACTLWDLVASFVTALAVDAIGELDPFIPFLCGIVTGVGFASMPFWIYRGYGHFLFENTWADVSCFFTEGYAMAFPLVIAPALALATLARECLVLRMRRRVRIIQSEIGF